MVLAAPGVTQKIGVPQRPVLGPLLFNIFIKDIFSPVNDTEVCNYADDTPLYVRDKNLRTVLAKLEKTRFYCQNGSLTIS